MKAVRLHAMQDLRVEEIAPPPPPGPNEITMSVTAAGLCGSDLYNYKTGDFITRAPSVVGHELAGTITALGEGVDHVQIGDRVIVDSRHVCGECAACQAGRLQNCENLDFVGRSIDGGFAEALNLPARNVIAAPEFVPDRHLALSETLAIALHVLNRLTLPEGERITVAGCGPIGALVALLASRQGCKVELIDRNHERGWLVAGITGGEWVGFGHEPEEPVRYGVDTTGNPAVIVGLLDRLSDGGSLALVGLGEGEMAIEPMRLVRREIALIGCHCFGDELGQVVELLPELSPVLDRFIGEVIGLDDVPDAYERHLGERVEGLKTIIRCNAHLD